MTSPSELLGYTSIACWLGAQFPQVLENIRNQSCEGLSLPFLTNWLLGDLSNLIGCVLTHQLPFQTYLATYFVFVDLTLYIQYFYYGWYVYKKPVRQHVRARTTSTVRRMSFERAPRYRTLSAVAANVAAAAALAAQEEEGEHIYTRSRFPKHSVERSDLEIHEAARSDDDVDEDALAALADSFHSEGGRTSRQKRVSWSQERFVQSAGSGRGHRSPGTHASLQITPSDVDTSRGRPLQRDADAPEDPDSDSWRQSISNNRTSSRASRRSVGLVFLGVWALFGVGTLAGGKRSLYSSDRTSLGHVLSAGDFQPPEVFVELPISAPHDTTQPTSVPLPLPVSPYDDSHQPSYDEPSSQRTLGRIFAWLCTTLYLTSRLPQIWKNYARKSVEGLSMYLFIFAFLGNVFYVASILTSPNMDLPPPQATDFIRESIPYLLGSAGTLCFDITIVTQSFIYRPRPALRGRRNSTTRSRALDEEQAGLLGEDALSQSHPDSSTLPSKNWTSNTQDA